MRPVPIRLLVLMGACGLVCASAVAQNVPLAIVPVEGVQLSGAMSVADGKAMIGSSGAIKAGEHPALVTLPHRGNLRLCASTRVSLSADSSVSNLGAGEAPGLMLALERGALEAGFATGKNSDVILTPDFRIVISGPGTASVNVRLGDKGDTCVDNRGPNAPYVTVSSIFDGGVYRVQADQRVMFQHGSLNEVVDREKESCGCPPDVADPMTAANSSTAAAAANPFPVAQSEGLAPLPTAPPNAVEKGTVSAQATAQLSYEGDKPQDVHATVETAPTVAAAPVAAAAPAPAKEESKPGLMTRLGHFFRKLFGG